MKTLTEFFGPHLVRALQTRQELLAAGKTPEELPAALGESLKLEGEKLQRLQIALELVTSKQERLKRVVVLQGAEGEKAPAGAVEREGLHYLIEFFPAPAGSAPQRQDDDRSGRRGRDGKGRDRKGGRGERRGDRRPQGAAAAGDAAGGAGASAESDPEKKRRRRKRGPRSPRAEGAPANPQGAQKSASPAAPAEPLTIPAPRPATAKAVVAPPSESSEVQG